MSYEFKSRIRFSEVGPDKKLTVPAVIDYLQDATTFQSEDLGVGVDFLGARDRAWLIAYWQIEIRKLPQLGDHVTVSTWPCGFRGFMGDRDFRMTDEQGEVLVQADSLWIYVDTVGGHPVRIDDDVQARYTSEDHLAMEKLSRKIKMPADSIEQDRFTVLQSHLDTNHHVNNGQYLFMAQQYLPEDFIPERIRVEYRQQARLHDEIIPWVSTTEDICIISLCDKEKKPYAVIEYKKA